jgi:hypothetical protein
MLNAEAAPASCWFRAKGRRDARDRLPATLPHHLHAEVYCLAAIELAWRRLGLQRALGTGPVPLLELDPPDEDDDDQPLDVFDVDPVYRPGFEP